MNLRNPTIIIIIVVIILLKSITVTLLYLLRYVPFVNRNDVTDGGKLQVTRSITLIPLVT